MPTTDKQKGKLILPLCVCALNELPQGDTTFYCEHSTEKSSEHGFDFNCTPAGGCGANASALLKLLALPPQR